MRSVLAVAQTPRLLPMIVLSRITFSCTPESADGNGSGGSTGRLGSGSAMWPRPIAASCVMLGPDVLDDVAARAVVERDAPVPVDHAAVLDRDVVEAVVADRGADALAVERVAVEVDRDPVRVDDQAVEQAVDEVVLHQDAVRDLHAAVHERRHRGGADGPVVGWPGSGPRCRPRRRRGTSSTRSPTAMPVSSSGEVQAVKAASVSSLHSNVASGSSLEKVNVAVREHGRRGPARTRSSSRAGSCPAAARGRSTSGRPASSRRCRSGRSRAPRRCRCRLPGRCRRAARCSSSHSARVGAGRVELALEAQGGARRRVVAAGEAERRRRLRSCRRAGRTRCGSRARSSPAPPGPRAAARCSSGTRSAGTA